MDSSRRYATFQSLQDLEFLERRPPLVHDRSLDLDTLDEIDFKLRYRFCKATAETIIDLVKPRLNNSSIHRSSVLSAEEKVCTALRFFAEGCFQRTIGDLGLISQSSSCRAINSVAQCLAELGKDFIQIPSQRECVEISQSYYLYSGFPGVVGALDCTHIPIVNPGGDQAELFRCRKGFFSLNVQTLSDHKLRIRNIVARWPGGTHDSTIFDSSRLRVHLENHLPVNSSSHVLGDSGYPLRPYLLTPFLNPRNVAEERYNRAHIRARNGVERQYGVWKKRFACLSHKLRGSISNSQAIIVATGVLHNIAVELRDLYPEGADDDPDSPDLQLLGNTVAGIAKRNTIVQSFFS